VSRRQLSILLNEYEKPPFQVINYLVAEMNYGGRVTDDKDLRLIRTIVESLICPEALREKFKYSPSGIYISPPAGTQADYLAYIDSLPSYASPEILGLHDNSEIVNSQN
jgi:dynein heavy chain, axonemal